MPLFSKKKFISLLLVFLLLFPLLCACSGDTAPVKTAAPEKSAEEAKAETKTLSSSASYAESLFDASYVHTIDIVTEDWDAFLKTCPDEEYSECTLIIDGEEQPRAGIRGKGNTSLSMVQSYGNNRYSFKVEFDHYDEALSYRGLDKLCLNNLIQDNTYMKDYLAYTLMDGFAVAAPLCSYVWLTVNGEDWGLYLAVEAVEDSFLERNFGGEGELYKPDSSDMGGGRGNGRDFSFDKSDMDSFPQFDSAMPQMPFSGNMPDFSGGEGMPPMDMGEMPELPAGENMMPQGMGQMPEFPAGENMTPQGMGQMPGFSGGTLDMPGDSMNMMGSSDVALIYTNDNAESYPNIFDNAKTNISDKDREQLIAALKKINDNSDIESAVDVDSVIRYFVVHNYLLNFDSYTGFMLHNYYLYEDGGILSMIPWDYNLAFGGFMNAGSAENLINYSIDEPVSGGSVESRPMLAWIFANEEYTELYHELFSEFIDSNFSAGQLASQIEMVSSMIAPYVEKDPTKFCSYDEFLLGIDCLESFCSLRAEAISLQLSGSSETVSANNLDVSAMGSMGGGHGGFSPSSMPGNPDFSKGGKKRP